MRAVVAENNVYRWAGKIVSTLLRIDSDAGTGVPNPYPTPLTLPKRDPEPLSLGLALNR